MRRYLCFVWLLMTMLSSYARTETGEGGRFYKMLTDSLKYAGSLRPVHFNVEKDTVSYMDVLDKSRLKILDMGWLGRPAYSPMPAGLGFSGDVPVVGWGSGGVVGNLDVVYMPGLMAVNSGSLGVLQTFESGSAYFGGIANKYGCYFGGVTRQLGVNARFTYDLTSALSATLFGVHYFGKTPVMPGSMLPLHPAAVGFYATSRFGGYFDYKFNEHWGVDVGAQSVRRFGSGKYDFQPMADPYYLMGIGEKKVKISLPVGQILYHIIKGR